MKNLKSTIPLLLIGFSLLVSVFVLQQSKTIQQLGTQAQSPSTIPNPVCLGSCPTNGPTEAITVSPSEAAPSGSEDQPSADPILSETPESNNEPCEVNDTASIQHDKGKKKYKHDKHDDKDNEQDDDDDDNRGGFIEQFIRFLLRLIELLLGGLGVTMPELPTTDPNTNPDPAPCDQPEPSQSAEPSTQPSDNVTPTLFNTTVAPSQPQPNSDPSTTAATKRNIPIAPEGGLGQYNLSSKQYIMAFRFVLDKPTTIDRWYYAINAEGASCVGGRTGYGSGNGGTEFGRIVEVDQATGFPTNKILAQESVNGCTAHNRSMSEFGLSKTHQAHFVQFTPISLEAGKMYAFLLSNTDANPGNGGSKGGGNHTSPNLNFAKLSDMGPHGKNTLDANAPGALYGYDPRETTMWSKDGGASWLFGAQVGWYDNDGDQGKMWVVGYRSGGKNIAHGYTYMNWPSSSSGSSITYKNVPKAVTLTDAGGASSGSVGVVTVTNTSTGVSATTPSLGSGVPVGKLSKPVPVAAGESYTIKASGSVESGSASFWDKIFGLGSNYSSSCSACGGSVGMPGLFALPHPYY